MPEEANAASNEAQSLGQRLRQAREAKHISLETAEEVTRIRRKYLEALEADDYSALPGTVFLRGFVRNYAQFLGLDPEAMLALLPADPAPAPPPVARRPAPTGDYPLMDVPLQPAPSWFNADLVIGILMLVALLGFVGWVVYRQYLSPYIQARSTPTATATATEVPSPSPTVATPATVQVQATAPLLPTASATPAGSPTATPTLSPTATATKTPTPLAPLEVTLIAQGRSWVEIYADGERVFRGFMVEGDEETFYAEERLQVHLGDASVVRVIANGQDMGYLGTEGEVVHKEFLVEGAPPSTATPTPVQGTSPPPEASPTATPAG